MYLKNISLTDNVRKYNLVLSPVTKNSRLGGGLILQPRPSSITQDPHWV